MYMKHTAGIILGPLISNKYSSFVPILITKFEYAKGIIRSRISKKDRQYNGQKKDNTRHTKNKINSGVPEGYVVSW